MEISAKVLADSLSPCGARLTTMEWTYPRCIHSEIMTHRMLSKNAASSRAIPVAKMLDRIRNEPFIPQNWGVNQKGMQAGAELTGRELAFARNEWLVARDYAVVSAEALEAMGLHKQIVNRIVEPWMFITIIVSATSWDNVWGLRCHPDAEPHFQDLAVKARAALQASTPKLLKAGDWHLPLVYEEDWAALTNQARIVNRDPAGDFRASVQATLVKVSVGRCARVSYLTHDGRRDIQADVVLHDRLIVQQPMHATPAEHVAQAVGWPSWLDSVTDAWLLWLAGDTTVYQLRDRVVATREDRAGQRRAPTTSELLDIAVLNDLTFGNFLGFQQYRKMLANEHIGGLMP